MKILALDVATSCGWSLSNDGSLSLGIWDLSIKKSQTNGIRLLKLWDHLEAIHQEKSLDLIAVEGIGGLRGHAFLVLSTLRGTVELWCALRGVEFRTVPPKTIKKYATGTGNANKQQMMDAAKREWPHLRITNDDRADSLWLLDFVTQELKSC